MVAGPGNLRGPRDRVSCKARTRPGREKDRNGEEFVNKPGAGARFGKGQGERE